MSTESSALHAYMFYPHASDIEAYSGAISPKHHLHHRLTTYSKACWSSQLRNAVLEGICLPLSKFWCMSSAIVMHSGGPISWKAEQQERTSLSLCKAEIWATNTNLHLTVNTWNMITSLSSLGYSICNTKTVTPPYTTITRHVLNGVIIWQPKAIATSNNVKMLFGSGFIRNPVFINHNHNYYSTVMNYWSVTINVIR